jgi:hypothetical protein
MLEFWYNGDIFISPGRQKNLKFSQHFLPLGAIIDALEQQVSDQTSAQALQPFFVHIQSQR